MRIEAIRLTHKTGGRSGDYAAETADPTKENR
jgi:hypothetical protein